MKLAGAFLAVFAFFVQPLVTLNIPAVFAAPGIPRQVVINEFSSGTSSDWIELYNTTGAPTDLTGWKIKDAAGNDKLLSGSLAAHGFTSVNFSSWLNADGDTIIVEDDAGVAINTVVYGTAGSVAAPSAAQFAARATDNSDTWELRTTSSRDATNNVTMPSPELVAQDFGIWDNSPSFKGFNVGFAAANFGEVTSVKLDVTREDGSHVIRTARADMLAHLSNKTSLTQGSAPFVVNPGTSDGLSDSSWWSGQTNVTWTSATKPVSVMITVVGDNGTKSVTNNTFANTAPGYENILPPQVEACNGSTFDDFTLGSVNGQNGWKSTGPYDQEVVNNTYGYASLGCKSLRISNAATSGSFGDHTFSAEAAEAAGETAVNDHFEASFDIASTKANVQPGMSISISPDRGDGSRMSYLSFTDTAAGIDVHFYDVQGTGNPANFVSKKVATLDRAAPHNVKFVMDFKSGPSNDVVKIYIDGDLVHTGTSWENYYRYDSEAHAEQSPRNVDSLGFFTRGTAVSANDGKGYLFDNVSVSTSKNDTQKPDVTFVNPTQNAYVQNLNVDVDMDGTGSNLTRYGFDVTGPGGLGFSTHNYDVDQPTVELRNFDLCAAQNYGDDCPTELPNGTYTVRAKAYDAAGNRNISTTLKVTVDTIKPKAMLKTSSVGSVPQKILKEADFSLSDNYKVRAYIINGHRVEVAPNKWSDANDIKVGARHGVYGENTIEVEDVAGNVSEPFVFYLDNVEPKATVNDRSVGTGTTFSKVYYDLFDAYKIDKVTINGVEKDLSDNNWSNVDGIVPGKFGAREGTNTLVVYDVAGNTKAYTFTLDTDAPAAASITYSNDNGNALTNNDVVATLTTDEAVRDIAGWTRLDETRFTKEFSSNGTFSVDFMDLAGNAATVTGQIKRIDRNAPMISGISDGARVKGTVHLSVFDPPYEGYFGFNADHGLKVNGSEVSTTETGDHHFLADVSGEGTYTVVATDKAGNTSATVTFTIDNTAPVLTDLTATQNDDNTFTLSVMTNDPAPVTFKVDGVEVPGAIRQGGINGPWTWIAVTGVLPVSSRHTFAASSTDSAGNLSSTPVSTFFVAPPETTTLGDGTAPLNRQLATATTTPTADLFATRGSDTAVSDEEGSDEGEVLGTEDSSSPAGNAALAPSDQGWKLWGIAWYWWLLAAAALAGIWWMIAAWRRRQAEADPSAGL